VVARIADGAGVRPAKAKEEAKPAPAVAPGTGNGPKAPSETPLSPAVRRLLAEHQIDPGDLSGTGKGGRLTKEDVLRVIEGGKKPAAPGAAKHAAAEQAPPAAVESLGARPSTPAPAAAATERVPMTRLRKRIAERLVEAQRTAAILTTFNEIDMSGTIELRKRHKERFQKAHGIGLGFMSLFARACVLALHELPIVNASIEADDVVYHRQVHLGIAVGTPRGLVVPVVRNADGLSIAGLEKAIADLAVLARDGKLLPDHLAGGTFTISNGGVYGSLMSTPILTPPQSAILGMHKIEERPIAVEGQVVIRPMMYVALSYDHRLIDGEQAVTFLVKIKERIEDPSRLVLEV
jgi:2-oxoglutarate dehydrogenase E2 component (dihydrolipoamide succinyltransferase)